MVRQLFSNQKTIIKWRLHHILAAKASHIFFIDSRFQMSGTKSFNSRNLSLGTVPLKMNGPSFYRWFLRISQASQGLASRTFDSRLVVLFIGEVIKPDLFFIPIGDMRLDNTIDKQVFKTRSFFLAGFLTYLSIMKV